MKDDELKALLTKIKALCENPHWTASRRWLVLEAANQALAILGRSY